MLSAALIVKDEADNLDGCLRSIAGAVEDIVVLDTGSTDDTVEIARRYTPRVFRSDRFTADVPPEAFHFGEARNEALDYCRGDWVLSIDADERLRGDLTAVKPEADDRAFYLRLKCDGRPLMPVLRLFRRLPQMRWAGRVHEHIAAGGLGEEALCLPFDTCHLEHVRSVMRDESNERNMALLRLQLTEATAAKDGRLLSKTLVEMGDTYRESGRYHEALGYYTAVAHSLGSSRPVFLGYLYCAAADCYAHVNLPRQAEDCLRNIIDVDPHCASAYAMLGKIQQVRGRLKEAGQLYRRALAVHREREVSPLSRRYSFDKAEIEKQVRECQGHSRTASAGRGCALAGAGAGAR